MIHSYFNTPSSTIIWILDITFHDTELSWNGHQLIKFKHETNLESTKTVIIPTTYRTTSSLQTHQEYSWWRLLESWFFTYRSSVITDSVPSAPSDFCTGRHGMIKLEIKKYPSKQTNRSTVQESVAELPFYIMRQKCDFVWVVECTYF